MIHTILSILGALFLLFMLVFFYSACHVASREDEWMEHYYQEHKDEFAKKEAA